MKKKRVITGYIGKTVSINWLIGWLEDLIYSKKGEKRYWKTGEYPPRKVEITIKEI